MTKPSEEVAKPVFDFEKFNLEHELFMLGVAINRALTSCAVIASTLNIFNYWKKLSPSVLVNNPANYWLYPSLEDAIELALVQVKEKIWQLNLQGFVHGSGALKSHRHIISHPGQKGYKHEDVQEFFNKQQHDFDPKHVRLWGVSQSLYDWGIQKGLNSQMLLPPRILFYPEC